MAASVRSNQEIAGSRLYIPHTNNSPAKQKQETCDSGDSFKVGQNSAESDSSQKCFRRAQQDHEKMFLQNANFMNDATVHVVVLIYLLLLFHGQAQVSR